MTHAATIGKAKKLFRKHECTGAGPFAVVFCSYMHPSAGFSYGDVRLFETFEKALSASLWDGSSWFPEGYCHGCFKMLTGGNRHAIVDLARSNQHHIHYTDAQCREEDENRVSSFSALHRKKQSSVNV